MHFYRAFVGWGDGDPNTVVGPGGFGRFSALLRAGSIQKWEKWEQ